MRRRACVLSAAALVGTVLGAAAPAVAGEPTAEVSPSTATPGGTVTISVTCEPSGGSAPASIDAGSQAFEQGSVQLQRVSAEDPGPGRESGEGRESGPGRESGAGRESGSGRESGAGLESGTGRDPATGLGPGAGRDPATGNDPPTGQDPARGGPATGYGPAAGNTPEAVPDTGGGLDPVTPGSRTGPQASPDSAVDPSPAAVPVPEATPAPAAARALRLGHMALPAVGFRAAAVHGPAGVFARATPLAPAAAPDPASGAVYSGTARIAPAGNFQGGAGGAGESSEWSVDGTCPAAPGGQGKRWSASFAVARGGEEHDKEPHGDGPRPHGAHPEGMQRGVQAGEGGAFTDSVPARVAGGLLIVGALGAAVQRILLRRGSSRHR